MYGQDFVSHWCLFLVRGILRLNKRWFCVILSSCYTSSAAMWLKTPQHPQFTSCPNLYVSECLRDWTVAKVQSDLRVYSRIWHHEVRFCAPPGYPPLPSSLYSSPYLSLGHLDPPTLSQHPLYDSHKGQSLASCKTVAEFQCSSSSFLWLFTW